MSSTRVIGGRPGSPHRSTPRGPAAPWPTSGRGCPSPIGRPSNAVERHDPGDARREERLVGGQQVVGPDRASTGFEPDRRRMRQEPRPGRPDEDRRRSGRGGQRSARDEPDVRGRRLAERAVGRQEQGVVGARPGGLELRVDVVGARRRLDPGERRPRVASDGARDRPHASFQELGGGGAYGQAWMTIVGGTSPKPAGSNPRRSSGPRLIVIRSAASPGGSRSEPGPASPPQRAGRRSRGRSVASSLAEHEAPGRRRSRAAGRGARRAR